MFKNHKKKLINNCFLEWAFGLKKFIVYVKDKNMSNGENRIDSRLSELSSEVTVKTPQTELH